MLEEKSISGLSIGDSKSGNLRLDIKAIVSGAWTHPLNEKKTFDSDLADIIYEEVYQFICDNLFNNNYLMDLTRNQFCTTLSYAYFDGYKHGYLIANKDKKRL